MCSTIDAQRTINSLGTHGILAVFGYVDAEMMLSFGIRITNAKRSEESEETKKERERERMGLAFLSAMVVSCVLTYVSCTNSNDHSQRTFNFDKCKRTQFMRLESIGTEI